MPRSIPAVGLVLVASLAVIAAVAACTVVHDLGSTGVDGSDDSGTGGASDSDALGRDDATSSLDASDAQARDATSDGATGPLANALPSGYCCTNDEQCRMRHCLDSPSGRMCFDECSADTQWFCDRPNLDFRCDLAAPSFDQACRPQAGESFACLDPSAFVRGTKEAGACCAMREDGLLGQECASNLCMTKGNGPFFCTQICEAGADCPTDHDCVEHLFYKLCVPRGTTYTCAE